VARGGSTVVVGGWVAGGVTAAAGGEDGAAAGFDAATAAGRSGGAGVSSMTAGTGSIATRGGGSGISSGIFSDERAGLDAHALTSSAKIATTPPCLIRIP
jgi:hypothetical protein